MVPQLIVYIVTATDNSQLFDVAAKVGTEQSSSGVAKAILPISHVV